MYKVLIVDDQVDIRRMMSIVLGDDYALLEAQDGISALNLVRQHKPDVVLLDIMMPGDVDGLQVLQAIRNDPEISDTCVIMVSAKGQVTDSALGMQMGANAYFVKPFSPLQLQAAIREQLAKMKSNG